MVPRILTLDEQTALYRAWHDAGDAKALAELVACIRMGFDAEGRRFARKWSLPEADILSAVGEIIVETIALGDWDPSRASLTTYLWRPVEWGLRKEGGMYQAIVDRSDRIWRYGTMAMTDPEKARQVLSKRLGREVKASTIQAMAAIGHAQHAVRIDAVLPGEAGESGATFGDGLASPDPGPEELTGRAEVAALMGHAIEGVRAGLTDRQQAILDRRILAVDAPASLDALATTFGLSRERVRQVELKVVAALRKAFTAAGLTPEAVLR